MDRRALRVALWFFVGSLLLQTAWILALPPFRGVDEFDHAYRAVAVAHGQWHAPGTPAPNGRGELVRVTPGIVADAGPVCATLAYTKHDNCSPAQRLEDGSVLVASASARYNPVYYALVGTVAKPFDGASALYAMRMASAVLCSLLLALASWVTARWATTRWPLVGLVTTLMPVTVYATAITASNGVETYAALGLWTSLIGLGRVDAAHRRAFLVTATVFAVPLVGVRTLGPLWALCIVGLWAGLVGRRTTGGLVRDHPVGLAAGALVSSVTAMAAAVWSWWVGTNEIESFGPFDHALRNTLVDVPLWFLQSIAAFPTRNEQAPTVVYAAAAVVVVALLAVGVRRAAPRVRWVMALTFAVALLIPFAIQLQAYPVGGAIWQGRYGWPVSMGVLLLGALAVEVNPPGHRLTSPLLLSGGALWAVAQAVSAGNVAANELVHSPLSGDPRWLTLPPWALAVLAVVGVAAWGVGTATSASAHPPRVRGDAVPRVDEPTPEPVGPAGRA